MPTPDPSPPAATLRILLFAGMAELVGSRWIDLPWSGGRVADLRLLCVARHPALAPLLARSAVARGEGYLGDDEPVAAADELAIIPPVSGG